MSRIGDLNIITPNIGAEVLNVDLANLTDGLLAQLKKDLQDHFVLFFRDQVLTLEEFKNFGKRFGKLDIHPAAIPPYADHPEVLVMETDEKTTKVYTEAWHTDSTASAEPPLGSILYMDIVPENGGGDTLFSTTCAAYDALSQTMKCYLEGMTALHDAGRLSGQPGIRADAERLPTCEHPVVRTHPVSGRKCLFVNRVYTSHIIGIPPAESDAILAFLYDHMEQPLFQCRFKWRPGSIAFWDNRCTLHRSIWDFYPQRRKGHRITICGDKPR